MIPSTLICFGFSTIWILNWSRREIFIGTEINTCYMI